MKAANTPTSVQALSLWIAIGFVVAFNIAAAMAKNPQLTFLALGLTATVASAAILVAFWNARAILLKRTKS